MDRAEMESPINEDSEAAKCHEEVFSRRLFDDQKFNKALQLFSEDEEWAFKPSV